MHRLLIVHNHYRTSAPSGENVAFSAEVEMLRRRGHEVLLFERQNDELGDSTLGKIRASLSVAWNPSASREFSNAARSFRPDLVHVHNTFPQISPSVFYAAKAQGIPSVLTLHNFRLFCAAGVPLRDGVTCFECVEQRSVKPAMRYGCYRRSRISTAPLALGIALHRSLGTWSRQVSAYIALSEFQRAKLIEGGLPAKKIAVKPHFYPGTARIVAYGMRSRTVVYAGRLTREKGVRHLIRAWAQLPLTDFVLEILGDGADRLDLERLVMELGLQGRVVFRGFVGAADVIEALRHSRAMAFPSLCVEGFPMAIREAYAHGVPVVASRIGSLIEWVRDGESGLTFGPAAEEEMAYALTRVLSDENFGAKLARGALTMFSERLTEAANYDSLMGIYDTAVAGGDFDE